MKSVMKSIIVIMLIAFLSGYSYAGIEADANVAGISVVPSENSVFINWTKYPLMKYYELKVESVYGVYSQSFSTISNYKQVGLSDPGIYKITLNGFDGNSSVEFVMGYFYFSFGNGSLNIDTQAIATAIANSLDIKPKEIDKKIYRFRVMWNSSWWSGLSISNSSDTRVDTLMTVVDPNTHTKYSSTISVQPNDSVKGTGEYFLKLVGITPSVDPLKRSDYLMEFECPTHTDIELYVGQLVNGKIVTLTKDSSLDDYTYKE